jgi:transcriptional regulator of acetoin/glycerol metabolism
MPQFPLHKGVRYRRRRLTDRLLAAGLTPGVRWRESSPMLLPLAGESSSTVVTPGELMMILELHRQKISAIARQLGIDRKTVRMRSGSFRYIVLIISA